MFKSLIFEKFENFFAVDKLTEIKEIKSFLLQKRFDIEKIKYTRKKILN